jgi:hypothetical protein
LSGFIPVNRRGVDLFPAGLPKTLAKAKKIKGEEILKYLAAFYFSMVYHSNHLKRLFAFLFSLLRPTY